MLEDVYEDNLLGDPNDLERILEPENDEQEQQNGDEEQEGQDGTAPQQESGETKTVKKRVVKNPQPKLNPERLTGPRGIIAIEEEFRDFKFCGKGHEKKDLDRVMKRLEHWAHRLFPRMQFDDCLEKIEKLGVKRPVATYVKKIRMGLEVYDATPQLLEDNEDDFERNIPQVDEPVIDPFEELLGRHLMQITPDDLPSSVPDPTPLSQSVPSSQIQPAQLSQNTPSSSQSVGLTAEQRERMLKNRMLAEERRLARYKMKLEMEKKSTEAETSMTNESVTPRDSVAETERKTAEMVAIEILETGIPNCSSDAIIDYTPHNEEDHLQVSEIPKSISSIARKNSTSENEKDLEKMEIPESTSQDMPISAVAESTSRAETEEEINMANRSTTPRESLVETEQRKTEMDVDGFPKISAPNSNSNTIIDNTPHNEEDHLRVSETPKSISNLAQNNLTSDNEKDLETVETPESTPRGMPVSAVAESTLRAEIEEDINMANKNTTPREILVESEQRETQMDVDEFLNITTPSSSTNTTTDNTLHNEEEHLRVSETPKSISNMAQKNSTSDNEKDLESMEIDQSTPQGILVSTVTESNSGAETGEATKMASKNTIPKIDLVHTEKRKTQMEVVEFPETTADTNSSSQNTLHNNHSEVPGSTSNIAQNDFTSDTENNLETIDTPESVAQGMVTSAFPKSTSDIIAQKPASEI